MRSTVAATACLVTLLALWAATSTLPLGPARADDDDAPKTGLAGLEGAVETIELENGLTVLVLERHHAPVVSFATVVRVGSVNEVPGHTGVAHVFEHLAFKGTINLGATDVAAEREALGALDVAFAALKAERAKGHRADAARLEELGAAFEAAKERASSFVVSDEYSTIIERHGGSGLNATTSADLTSYFVSLPTNRLELYLYLEADRFANPVMRDFFEEKDVVMEERRMRTESNPVGKLIEEFVAAAFKAHPYGQPTIGHRSDLEALDRETAAAFYERFYVPANTTFAIVGDVTVEQVRELIERYFSKLPKRPKPADPTTVEPPQEGEKRIAIEARAQPIYAMGFHKPGLGHPDDEVYDVLVSLLAEGRSSRLHRRLVQKDRVAVQAGALAGMPGNRFPNLFLLYGVPTVGTPLPTIEATILEEIERLQTEPPTAEELAGVKTRQRANFLRGMRGNQGLAVTLAQTHALAGDWRELFRSLERTEKVTAEDVVRVAKGCFTKKNRIVGWIEPPGGFPKPAKPDPAPAKPDPEPAKPDPAPAKPDPAPAPTRKKIYY